MPTKKKQLSEEQMIKLMTRRRNCIQKYRKNHKNKTISFSNPLVQEIPKEPKKRVNKKKAVIEDVPVEATEVLPIIQPKKKRTYKKKVEDVPVEATEVEPIIQPKKKRTYKKKVEEPEPIIYTD